MDPNYVGIIVSVFNKERYTHATKAEVIGFQAGSNNDKVVPGVHLLFTCYACFYNDSCAAGRDSSARGALAAERLARGPRARRHEHSLPARVVLAAAAVRGGGDDELRARARPARHPAASRTARVRHSCGCRL